MSITGWGGDVTLTVEAAFSVPTSTSGVWGSGLWDTALWGVDVTWTDITAYLRSFTTIRAFQRETARWASGTATVVLDNSDGRFSPAHTSGPYASGGVTGIRPWRPIRATVTYAGTTYPVFYGYAIDFEESYPGFGVENVVVISAVDEIAKLAGFTSSSQGSLGDGETSGARIHRIINNAGSTANRAVEGLVAMQATTLEGAAVTLLDLTADSEGGWLWVDGDGTVVFDSRFSPIENSRMSTSQATFGDQAGEIVYRSAVMSYDGDDIINMTSFAAVGGVVQTASDVTSRAFYGDRQQTRTDLICNSSVDVGVLAGTVVARKKDPKLRIVSATYRPQQNPSVLWPQVLGRRVRDRVLVNRRPSGYTVSQPSQIEGVAHTVTPDMWETQFQFSDATFWDSDFGMWDSGIWDTSIWF